MAELLAVPLGRPPAWPPIKNDKSKIGAARHVLTPELEWRHGCREDIEAALTLIEKNEFSCLRRKQDKRAITQPLTALKKAQTAKSRLPLLQACRFENICNRQTSVAFCKRQQRRAGAGAFAKKTRPCGHRLFDAVQTAHHLVQLWLVVRRGIYDADNLNQQSHGYGLSAILLGKDANLLSRMSRYREAIDRAHAAVGYARDRRRERDNCFKWYRFATRRWIRGGDVRSSCGTLAQRLSSRPPFAEHRFSKRVGVWDAGIGTGTESAF